MPVHLFQRQYLYAGLPHVEHEVGKTLVFRRVPVGARHEQAVVGMVGAGVPHLLTVDDPLRAVEIGAGRRAGEIGTAAGLAEQLTPAVFAGDDPPQKALLDRVARVLQQRD